MPPFFCLYFTVHKKTPVDFIHTIYWHPDQYYAFLFLIIIACSKKQYCSFPFNGIPNINLQCNHQHCLTSPALLSLNPNLLLAPYCWTNPISWTLKRDSEWGKKALGTSLHQCCPPCRLYFHSSKPKWGSNSEKNLHKLLNINGCNFLGIQSVKLHRLRKAMVQKRSNGIRGLSECYFIPLFPWIKRWKLN